MGKILEFDSSRTKDVFRRRPTKARLAYRSENPQRFLPLEQRTRITPTNHTPAIRHTIETFKKELEELERQGAYLQLEKEDWALMAQANYRLLPENLFTVKKLPERTKAEIILKICRSNHDGWVYDYYQDFFNFFLDWEFVYLPLELVGVDQLYAIYEPLQKALPHFGLSDVSWETIVYVYDEWRKKFLEQHGIRRPADLILAMEEIANEYSALRPEIREALADRRLAYDVAGQISQYSAEIFRQKSRG